MGVIQQVAQQHARMVETCIVRGHRAKAIAAVHRAFDVIEEINQGLSPDDPVSMLLGPRITSVLESNDVTTIGELCEHDRESLLALPQVQSITVDKIEKALADHGFTFDRFPSSLSRRRSQDTLGTDSR
jgi:DNA-directed RNA polymerase alpha subunit